MGLGKFVAKSAKKAVRRAYRERHPIDPLTKSFVDDILPDIEDGDDEKKSSIIIEIIKGLCVLLLIFGFVALLITFMITSIHQIFHS